ncbi:MAG: cytochrome c peroxidase [Phycisphaerales bacterium]
MYSEKRLHLIALPLALFGLVAGFLLVWFDPVSIARQVPTTSLARRATDVKSAPVPIEPALTPEELEAVRSFTPLPPPEDNPTNVRAVDPKAAQLGHSLFFDPRLSGTSTVACSTCHDPRKHFADGRDVAQGIGRGQRNTPTLSNVAHQRWFTWDGRDDTMWSQAIEPIEAPLEMGGNRVAVVRLLAKDPAYRVAYERVFGPLPPLDAMRIGGPRIPEAAKPMPESTDDPLHRAWFAMRELDRDRIDRVFANVGKALEAYQRLLVDDDSALDRFVAGMDDNGTTSTSPLDAAELRGLRLFVGKAKCIQCHHGPMLSDGEFHNIGVPEPDGGLPRDPGRYEGIERLKRNPFRAAGQFSDAPESEVAVVSEALVNRPDNWGAFRTPSLRGVGVTAPYMHAGQFKTLEEVVRFYSTLEGATQIDHHAERLLQPLHLTDEEIADLVAFLGTLTGTGPPSDLLVAPASPFEPRQFGR